MELSNLVTATEDCGVEDANVWLMQSVVHTTTCGSFAVSAGAMEITGPFEAL